MEEHKKIIFRLEQDEDGYPPSEAEGLWAIPLPNGNYEIDNIPFFVLGVSNQDEVSAIDVAGELHFEKLLKPSQISTFRLLLSDPQSNAKVRLELKELGCRSEYNQHIGLIAVEVPASTPIHPVLDYIVAAKELGILDYEEGALRHKL